MKYLYLFFFLFAFVRIYSQDRSHIPEDREEPKGDLEISVFTYGNSPKDNVVRYPGSEYIVLKVKNVGTIPMSNWRVDFYLSELNGNHRHEPENSHSYPMGQSLCSYCSLDKALEPGETYTYKDRYYVRCALKEIPTPPESGTEYLLFAYLIFVNSPNRDLNRYNNSKSIKLVLKPRLDRSVSDVSVVNNGSSISFSNLTEKYLGGKIYLSGLSGELLNQIDINTLDNIIIDNKWKNTDILLIKIIDKNGECESLKIRNK